MVSSERPEPRTSSGAPRWMRTIVCEKNVMRFSARLFFGELFRFCSGGLHLEKTYCLVFDIRGKKCVLGGRKITVITKWLAVMWGLASSENAL